MGPRVLGVSFNEVSAEKDLLQCYISNCVTRDPDGAYVARFPWRSNPPSLPSNFAIAERRTCQMLKRLSKTPDLLFVYNNVITDQQTRGHVEPPLGQFNVHYIPHHAVEKDSPTTPIRVVFDCSYRQSFGYPCLNDCLLIGSPCIPTYVLSLSISGIINMEFLLTLKKHSYMFAFTQMTGTTLAFSG